MWTINSKALDHMTGNKSIISTLISISSSLLVTLIDGSTSYTKGGGTANAASFLSLSHVIYTPKFYLIG